MANQQVTLGPRRSFETAKERDAYKLGQNDGIEQAAKVIRMTAVIIEGLDERTKGVLEGVAAGLTSGGKVE